MRCCVLFAMLSATVAAQQPPAAAVPPFDGYRVGRDVTAPAVVSKAEPEYTEEARIVGLEGAVVLSLVVSEDGTARDIRVRRPLGLGLDEQAIKAVGAWRFRPGTKQGS